MRNDRRIAITPRQLNRFEGLSHSTNLVDLDQDRVGNAILNSLLQPLNVSDKKIIAHQLNAVAGLLRKRAPAFPIILSQTIFNRDDRILPRPIIPEARHLFARKLPLVALLEDVLLLVLVVELARGRIKRQSNLLTG